MATWIGALVETRDHADLAALLAEHHIEMVGPSAPWILVHCDAGLSHLHLPDFAEALSLKLDASVIGFLVQTTGGVEQIEHWQAGKLVRKLEYSGDAGGWVTQAGTPQPWERAYFFAEDESTAEDGTWPSNLGDELTDDERARYECARAAQDASGIMDLLVGASLWPLQRLCRHFGVDPCQPAAQNFPRKSWKPRVVLAAVAVFLAGMLLLGMRSR